MWLFTPKRKISFNVCFHFFREDENLKQGDAAERPVFIPPIGFGCSCLVPLTDRRTDLPPSCVCLFILLLQAVSAVVSGVDGAAQHSSGSVDRLVISQRGSVQCGLYTTH